MFERWFKGRNHHKIQACWWRIVESMVLSFSSAYDKSLWERVCFTPKYNFFLERAKIYHGAKIKCRPTLCVWIIYLKKFNRFSSSLKLAWSSFESRHATKLHILDMELLKHLHKLPNLSFTLHVMHGDKPTNSQLTVDMVGNHSYSIANAPFEVIERTSNIIA